MNNRGCENLPEDKNVINIGTWNVRTLNGDAKLGNLILEINRLNIDILGISETHWTDEVEEAFETDGHVIIQSCRRDGIHRQGVALILSKELAHHLVGYTLVNERIMSIQLATRNGPLFVFQVYAPDSS